MSFMRGTNRSGWVSMTSRIGGLKSPELDLVWAKLEASWERILGVRPEDEHWHFPWEKRSIQATFWVLRREHVISVERFISR